MARFAVILPAAGKSSRFKSDHYKKPFAPLANRAVWLHAAEKFINRDDVIQVIVVISADDRESFSFRFSSNVMILDIDVVEGGAERADSVENALAQVKPEAEYICVHDAARPCLANEWIDQVFRAAEKSGAAILATPIAGTIKRVDKKNQIVETVPRAACGKRKRRKCSGANCCKKPTPSVKGFRRPTKRSWSSGSAARSRSYPARRST